MPSVSLPTLAMTAGLSAETVGTAATIGAALPSLATVGTVASLAGTAIGGLGAIQQSQAAKAAAGYNAQLQANNAQVATQNAAFAGAEGEANSAISQAKTRAQIGATLANQGASGIDVNSGSALDTRESEAKLGALNTDQIRANAARSAYGFQTQSANASAESQLYSSEERSEATGGYLSAGATVLGGVGSAASKYNQYLLNGGGITA